MMSYVRRRAVHCTSSSHSHDAVCGPRARHARPSVVTRVTAGGVVLPACLVAPCVAVGGDVQIHECSPLVRSGGGHDTHSDNPLERRAHVQDKNPTDVGERTRQQRINSDAVRAVTARAPRRGMRQRAAPADRQTAHSPAVIVDCGDGAGKTTCRIMADTTEQRQKGESACRIALAGPANCLERQPRDQQEHHGHHVAPR